MSNVRAVAAWCDGALLLCADTVARLASGLSPSEAASALSTARLRIAPDALYEALLELIDVLVCIDSLKDQKSALQNDFALFKRLVHMARDKVRAFGRAGGGRRAGGRAGVLSCMRVCACVCGRMHAQ